LTAATVVAAAAAEDEDEDEDEDGDDATNVVLDEAEAVSPPS
jgi:hypothetical protein